MPILTLDIIAARLFGDIRLSAYDKLRLFLTAKLDVEERLRLTTGDEIKDVAIYADFITIHADERTQHFKQFTGWADSAKAVGTLNYFPLRKDELDFIPATLHFHFYPTESQLTDLIALAQHGRFPCRLNVTVPEGQGMKYGWEPDGSGKDWDNVSNHSLPIESVQYEVNLAAPATDTPAPPDNLLLPAFNRILFWQQCTCFMVLLIGIFLALRRWI